MDSSYDGIRPLIVDTRDEPGSLSVTFRCPASGTQVISEGEWEAPGLVRSQAGVAKRSLLWSLRSSIASSVRMAAGNSAVGRVGGSAAADVVQYAGGTPGGGPVHRSGKDREKAAVAAFAKVQHQFRWDDGGRRWVAASSAVVERSAFDEHLAAHPVSAGYDRELLNRLLAALVAADGRIEDDERASFAALAPGADLDALAARRPPSAVDFEESNQGPTRETILLLGWAVALSDSNLDQAEEDLLAVAARGLGVDEGRAAELKQSAQRHIVEQAIAVLAAQGTSTDSIRYQVEGLGDRIGLGADEAARSVIRWTRRQS